MPCRPEESTADAEALQCLQHNIHDVFKDYGSLDTDESSKKKRRHHLKRHSVYKEKTTIGSKSEGQERYRERHTNVQMQHFITVSGQDQNEKSMLPNTYPISPVSVSPRRSTIPDRIGQWENDNNFSLSTDIAALSIEGRQVDSVGHEHSSYNCKGHGDRASNPPESDLPSQSEQPPERYTDLGSTFDITSDGHNDARLQEIIERELSEKWILNLSMHFKDNYDHEKFFITYAQTPNQWRRVTVSCDYRGASEDTLEGDLRTLHFSRDKSARVYESIRESLPEIDFCESVTNLKLKTEDGRLHVHVTEDVNEIIKYPPLSAVHHLDCKTFLESALSFDSHMSGFVYTVTFENQKFVKKEIPSPDTVDEFLYEVNALFALRHSKHVIRFAGLVVDDEYSCVKGLLIDYASGGALVDILHDTKDPQIPWLQREIWAKQIVEGLSDIHEQGFVQGDFTLSNIVLDENHNAKIIDINRRGCPVGWEPPELEGLIEDGQRISMYIGVKSDIFQLGMVLWALAVHVDEPERRDRPLPFDDIDAVVPDYFVRMVKVCLELNPSRRKAANFLLDEFPVSIQDMEAEIPFNESGYSYASPVLDPALRFSTEDFGESRQIPSDSNWEHDIDYDGIDHIMSTRSSFPETFNNEAFSMESKLSESTPGDPTSESRVIFSHPMHQDSGFSESISSYIAFDWPHDRVSNSDIAVFERGSALSNRGNLVGVEAHMVDEEDLEGTGLP